MEAVRALPCSPRFLAFRARVTLSASRLRLMSGNAGEICRSEDVMPECQEFGLIAIDRRTHSMARLIVLLQPDR